MNGFNQALLVLHFIGLAMGLSVALANMVMGGLIAAAAPSEKAVLGRFPPSMSRVGKIGLALLWVTGATLVFTRWGGFSSLPWQFHAKLSAVVVLTALVLYIHQLEGRIRRGDQAAAMRIQTVGKLTPLFAIVAIIFAVLTFD